MNVTISQPVESLTVPSGFLRGSMKSSSKLVLSEHLLNGLDTTHTFYTRIHACK